MAISSAEALYVCFSIFLLPITIPLLLLNVISAHLVQRPRLRDRLRRSSHFRSRSILISGVSTPQGLRLARAFYEAGHDVVGADFEPWKLPTYGRLSRAVSTFYRLTSQGQYGGTSYAHDVIQIIKNEKVDVWISCSERITAVEEAWASKTVKAKTSCQCFLLDSEIVSKSTSPVDFLSYVRSLGLATPERQLVKSRGEVHNILNQSPGKRRYTLHEPGDTSPVNPRSLLPRRTRSQTYNEVSRLQISKAAPLLLEEYMEGLEKHTTLAIVVDGNVKAFAAGLVSSDKDDRYMHIPATPTLQASMLLYVKTLVERIAMSTGPPSSYHVCVDFCVEELVTERGLEKIILPINGHFLPTSTLLLFQGLHGSLSLTRAYLSKSETATNGAAGARHGRSEEEELISTPSPEAQAVYLLVSATMQLVLQPMLSFLTFQMSPTKYVMDFCVFLSHLIWWQEGTYESWDPLPCWWLYHVTTPLSILLLLLRHGEQKTLTGRNHAT